MCEIGAQIRAAEVVMLVFALGEGYYRVIARRRRSKTV